MINQTHKYIILVQIHSSIMSDILELIWCNLDKNKVNGCNYLLYIIIIPGGGKSYTYKKIKYVCGVKRLVDRPHKFKSIL